MARSRCVLDPDPHPDLPPGPLRGRGPTLPACWGRRRAGPLGTAPGTAPPVAEDPAMGDGLAGSFDDPETQPTAEEYEQLRREAGGKGYKIFDFEPDRIKRE